MIVLNKNIDIMQELKNKGYSSYRLRKEKLLSETMITRIRKGEMVSLLVLDKLCMLLECQPADIILYIDE